MQSSCDGELEQVNNYATGIIIIESNSAQQTLHPARGRRCMVAERDGGEGLKGLQMHIIMPSDSATWSECVDVACRP